MLLLLALTACGSHATDPNRGDERVAERTYDVDRVEGSSAVTHLYEQAARALSEGEVEAACALYEQARDAEPENPQAWVGLGTCALSRGDRQAAEGHYAQAAELDPKSGNAHLGLGTCYALAGDDAQAARHYELAVEADPDNADAHWGAATSWHAQGKQAQAAEHARRFIELAPDSELVPAARAIAGPQ